MEVVVGGSIQPMSDLSPTSLRRAESSRGTPVRSQPAGRGDESPSSSVPAEVPATQAAPTDTAIAIRPGTPSVVAQQVEQFLKTTNSILSFEKDQSTQQIVVKVLDSETKEVLRQYPPEELLKMAQALQKTEGFLLDKRI